MAPILGRYGPFLLYTYAVVLGAGILLGLAWSALRLAKQDGAAGPWVDRVLVALLCGVLSGRAAFVALNWSYFDQRLDSAFNIWRGGIHFHGALVGGLLILWLWPARPAGRLLNGLAPGILLAATAGWLACYYEGCAYGAVTTLGSLAGDLPDVYGVFAVRYHTQLLGVAGSLLLLGAILWLDRRGPAPGRLFWLALAGLFLLHGAMTPLMGNTQPLLGPWRLDTALDLLLGGAAALAAAMSGASRK